MPSAEPSASIITMMSPVQAANPLISASPLPLPRWVTTLTSGRSSRATRTVLSVDLPSTRTTSWIQSGRVLKTYGRFSASFMAGMTTLTGGAIARWSETGRYGRAVRWDPFLTACVCAEPAEFRDRAVNGSSPGRAGRTKELTSLFPSRPVDRPPPGGPAVFPVRKGVLTPGDNETPAVTARISLAHG